ncbi:hypothetical protein C0J52_26571 [Blattella germanica]|nr:hypothetical protein C0J52_26571 [Blattella germanica]
MKALVYATPVPDEETLCAPIVDGCNSIRHFPGLHQGFHAADGGWKYPRLRRTF